MKGQSSVDLMGEEGGNQIRSDSVPVLTQQQLIFKIGQTHTFSKRLLVGAVLLVLFAIVEVIYQIVILVGIHEEVILIAKMEQSDMNVNLKLSRGLHIASITLCIVSNMMLFVMGIFGVFVIKRAMTIFKALHNRIHDLESLEARAPSSNMLINVTSRGIYIVVILVLVQIGMNFINIQKAQFEYLGDDQRSVTLDADQEAEALRNLRSGYQGSFIFVSVGQFIYFAFYLYFLSRFASDHTTLEKNLTRFISHCNVNRETNREMNQNQVIFVAVPDEDNAKRNFYAPKHQSSSKNSYNPKRPESLSEIEMSEITIAKPQQ